MKTHAKMLVNIVCLWLATPAPAFAGADAESKVQLEREVARANRAAKEIWILSQEKLSKVIADRELLLTDLYNALAIEMPGEFGAYNSVYDLDREVEITYYQGQGVTLKSRYGKCLGVDPETSIVRTEYGTELFQVIFLDDKDPSQPRWVRFKDSHGLYLGAKPDGRLYCFYNPGEWERFLIEPVQNKPNIFRIRTYHGDYVTFVATGDVFTYSNPNGEPTVPKLW